MLYFKTSENITDGDMLKSGYIEFATFEYYADAIHSAIVNLAS